LSACRRGAKDERAGWDFHSLGHERLRTDDGLFADALAKYSTAQKQHPQGARAIFRSGKVRVKLNRRAEATKLSRTAGETGTTRFGQAQI